MPKSLKNELEKLAKIENMSLNSYLLREVWLKLRGYYIDCPKCGNPVCDGRLNLPQGSKITFDCPFCDHTFETDWP